MPFPLSFVVPFPMRTNYKSPIIRHSATVMGQASVSDGVYGNQSGQYLVPTAPEGIHEGKKFWQQASVRALLLPCPPMGPSNDIVFENDTIALVI